MRVLYLKLSQDTGNPLIYITIIFCFGGKGGIRTLDTAKTVYWISSPAHSTTLPLFRVFSLFLNLKRLRVYFKNQIGES